MAFPIDVKNPLLDELLAKEGFPWNRSASYNGTIAATGNTQVAAINLTTRLHRLVMNMEGTIISSHPVYMFLSLDSDATGIYNASLYDGYIPANTPIPFKVNSPKGNNLLFFCQPQPNVTADGVTKVRISVMVSGVEITNDLNFKAKSTLYWIGDSISDCTGVTLPLDQRYQFATKNYLMDNSPSSNDCRLTVKAIGGKSGVQFDLLRDSGRLFVDCNSPLNIIMWQHGINDSSQSVGTSAYTAAINNMILYKQRYWPLATMVFITASPVQNNTRESNLIPYRTALLNAVAAARTAGDLTIFSVDTTKAFDRTVSNTYASTDTAGDGIHFVSQLSQDGFFKCITQGINYDGTFTNGLIQYGLNIG